MASRPQWPIVAEAESASTWNARVAVIRQVPGRHGTNEHPDVYSTIARRIYVPAVVADVGYVPWRSEYELARVEAAYATADSETAGFTAVDELDLDRIIAAEPQTLLIFRLLAGLTVNEFAEATRAAATMSGGKPIGPAAVKSIEGGRKPQSPASQTAAATINRIMTGALFPSRPGGVFRPKLVKPDTANGWQSVRDYAANRVPFPVFLHQRMYGGAFRQLLDATGTLRGDELEDPVETLLSGAGVPFIRTGAHNQAEIERRFGLVVRPAPDFVMFDSAGTLRAMLECKHASDGGTARDKAARFGRLRAEGQRLGGVPVFAVLSGMGWRRTRDALGPVVEHTDGRVYSLANLPEMLDTDPLPSLLGLRP